MNHSTPRTKLHLIHYDQQKYEEASITDLTTLDEYLDKPAVTWVDVEGTHCDNTIRFLSEKLHWHSLLVEDIVHEEHRPKMDEYDEHLYIVVKMLEYDDKKGRIRAEQISFILGKNYLISFQETGKPGDLFGAVRSRVKNNQGRHRKLGPDYLLYTLLDLIIDHYFTILEKIGERIETLEDEVIHNPTNQKLNEIYLLKRELIQLRHSVWPLREVVNRLEKESSGFVRRSMHVYLREAYEHTIQVIETLETYRDILSGLIDIHLSSMSNKMNAVMKVLTVISTIFMPLSFIVGVYGMNFQYMPELQWKGGYFAVLGLCATLVVLMLLYFRKKKWM
jgi:magnesium transporter